MPISKSLPLLILALAAAPVAAKPVADSVDPDGSGDWRRDAIAACIEAGGPRRGPDLTGDALRDTCGCAVERFMEGRRPEMLPPPAPIVVQGLTARQFRACAADGGTSAGPVPIEPSSSAEAPDVTAEAQDLPQQVDESPPSTPLFAGLLARLDGTGIPRPAWAGIAVLALMLLRLLFRRRAADDLMGPPRSMRPGNRPPNI